MRLDTLLSLLKPICTANAYNERVVSYVEAGDHWAAMRDTRSVETLKAAEIGQTLTTRFTVRWSPETALVDGTWHVRAEGNVYDVVAVRNVGRRQYVEIDAAVKQGSPVAC